MIAGSDYGTKMDDVILESLKPQVEEIKKKLASGGSLSHEDIITLTLYTQGNHINHIDMRMDSMDERIGGIEKRMDSLCVDFAGLRADFTCLESKVESKIAGLESKIDSRISGLEVKLEKFRGEASRTAALVSSVCAASIAIATVITNILNR